MLAGHPFGKLDQTLVDMTAPGQHIHVSHDVVHLLGQEGGAEQILALLWHEQAEGALDGFPAAADHGDEGHPDSDHDQSLLLWHEKVD